MALSTLVCMVESLYNLKDDDIKNLTVKEFNIKVDNIEHVAKLYNPYIGGDDEDKSEKLKNNDDMISQIRKKTRANKER